MFPYRFQITALTLCALASMALLGLRLDGKFTSIVGVNHGWFFSFFVFGVFVKRNLDAFLKILDSNKLAIIIVLFFILSFMRIKGTILTDLPAQILQLVFIGILGITMIFAYFRKHEESFKKETLLGKCLQYVGTRTLDIYLLHYFFLPRNLGTIGGYFNQNFNPTIEFLTALVISILVISLCLIVSNVIRTSSLLAQYLFGVKPR